MDRWARSRRLVERSQSFPRGATGEPVGMDVASRRGDPANKGLMACNGILLIIPSMNSSGVMAGWKAYVEQCLVPTLRRNDIVVMDNCRVHLFAGVREAIEKARATLRYLPKYSPDLNPIEMSYSKFKGLMRKVAARTVPALNRAIRSFIPQLNWAKSKRCWRTRVISARRMLRLARRRGSNR
jgi:transposase